MLSEQLRSIWILTDDYRMQVAGLTDSLKKYIDGRFFFLDTHSVHFHPHADSEDDAIDIFLTRTKKDGTKEQFACSVALYPLQYRTRTASELYHAFTDPYEKTLMEWSEDSIEYERWNKETEEEWSRALEDQARNWTGYTH